MPLSWNTWEGEWGEIYVTKNYASEHIHFRRWLALRRNNVIKGWIYKR